MNVRLSREVLDAIDLLIAGEPEPRPGRPEIIRRLLADRLKLEPAAPSVADAHHEHAERRQQANVDAKRRVGRERKVQAVDGASFARSQATMVAAAELKAVDAPSAVKKRRMKALTGEPTVVAEAQGKRNG